MKLGTEDKKKTAILGGLMLVAGYFFYDNVLSTPSYTPAPKPVAQRDGELASAAVPMTAPATSMPTPAATPRPSASRSAKNDEFHPVLRPKGRMGEAPPDPNTIDPTIHLELLAKVQDVKLEGGQRNLFQFGAAAPAELKGKEPKVEIVKVAKMVDYPRPYEPPAPPAPKVDPPPPPPTFKYYGLATKKIDNKRTAFFLDGEEIILATEGMTVKGRWKLVRIGAESVMLEDSQTKKQQPLTISEEAGGAVGGTGN
jgi:hypothetical protein